MTARTGLANLITELRAWTNTSDADYALGSITYWSDDHIQEALDRHRTDIRQQPLMVSPETNESDELVYYDYYVPAGYYEEASGGTAVWTIEDSTGANVGTANYSVNYQAGHIRFTANTLGTTYYLTGRKYDMHRAAAEIWRKKAAHVSERFDWSSDNHRVAASQLYKQYMAMAVDYEKQAPAQFVRMKRGDLNVYRR